MKKTALRLANSFFGLIGAKLVRSDEDDFSMFPVVRRILDHDMEINGIVDIGASNGKWSLEVMQILPQADFLAVEPLQERDEALKSLKREYSNFDYVLCVAGEKDGQSVSLNVADDLDGSTVNATGGERREVPCRTIDAIISEKKLAAPFLLKFDTHGFEIPILRGAREALKKTSVIIMEVYNFKITDGALRFHEMCEEMEGLGFRCYDISGPMLRPYDKAFWQMDLFFCRDDSKIFKHSSYK